MGALISTKACATCAFWCGPRKADAIGSRSECKSSSDKGICQNPKSPYSQKEKPANYTSCQKWEKWSALSKMK
jgi:hypothetical protein